MDRITPRYVFEARIRVCVQRASQNLVMEGWARDISETGLSAFVARGLSAGEVVTLEIPVFSSRWLSIPARVASCVGTKYGFQFTALSTAQRADIRHTVRDLPEVGPYDGSSTDFREPKHAEGSPSLPKQETERNGDSAFAERVRALIKRGYKPKVAVELVLQEVEIEHRHNPTIMEKARADAEDFLLRVRRGLI